MLKNRMLTGFNSISFPRINGTSRFVSTCCTKRIARRARPKVLAPMLAATKSAGIAMITGPILGMNSPRKVNAPKTSAGCTPTHHINNPVEMPVIVPLIATPFAHAFI
jgi:hypothetical protein